MKIENVPTEQFNRILKTLTEHGWKTVYSYNGFDAWIDYGEVRLKKGKTFVKFVWDNWTEGEISSQSDIQEIRSLL